MNTVTELEGFVARGWAIFPCHNIQGGICSCGSLACDSPGKHPRVSGGVKVATNDIEQIHYWAKTYPDANWALATGAPSGVWVLDIDAKGDGQTNLSQWLEENRVSLGETRVVATGGGGYHYYFQALERLMPSRNRVKVLPGVDVRSTGGYALLEGSNHISGTPYSVARDAQIAAAPDRLVWRLDAGRSGSSVWSAPSDLLAGVGEGERDDHLFRLACYLRRVLKDDREAVTMLVLTAAQNCTPPFPEADALIKVESAFSQDHTDIIDLDMVPFAAPDGQLYDFLADLEPDMVEAIERAVKQAKVRAYAARVLREERVAKYGDSAALDGDEFLFGEVASDVPIWGEGDNLLWVEGGGLMIPSDQGLGKSLTAQQIIAARLGVGPRELLGLPITPLDPGKVVVYLALDRPRQIARSMARLFRTRDERAIAKARLKIWTKPMPIDILGDPYAFADWIQDTFGSNVGDLIIDSVKDLTPANLSDGDVGQSLDMAWKECRARGMNTLILHHERKTGNNESRANRQPSLDNIYGSVWLTSGMDSILHISGKQGENLVRYTHLKAIINMLDPVDAIHDQENGRTSVLSLARNASSADAKVEQIFQVIAYGSRGGAVVTAADVVARATGVSKASVDRYVKKLLEAGRIVQVSEYVKASGTPATYRAAEIPPSQEGESPLFWEPQEGIIQ